MYTQTDTERQTGMQTARDTHADRQNYLGGVPVREVLHGHVCVGVALTGGLHIGTIIPVRRGGDILGQP